MAQTPGIATYCCLKQEDMLEAIVGSGINPDGILAGTNFNTWRSIKDNPGSGFEINTFKDGKGRPMAGKNRKIQVGFWVSDCSETEDGEPFDFCKDKIDCDATPREKQWDDFTVDCFVKDSFSVDCHSLEDICTSLDDDYTQKLRDLTKRLMKKANKKVAEKVISGLGNYFAYSGNPTVNSLASPRTIPLFDSKGVPQPQAMGILKDEYELQGVGDVAPVHLMGSSYFKNYNYIKGFGCCNDKGIDTGSGVDAFGYRDPIIDRCFEAGGFDQASKNLITFIPGAIQIVDWYEFEGIKEVDPQSGRPVWKPVRFSGNLVRQKVDLGTPFFGIPFVVDLQFEYDEKCNCLTVAAQKWFDVWKIPQEAFNPECNQVHNYCLRYGFECRDWTCDDLCLAGSVPAP